MEEPFEVPEDLIPARERKLAGQAPVSFSGRLDPPLLLHEDLKDGCGGQLWPAGIALAEFLLDRRDRWQGRTVLELGAGGGLVGLALALAAKRDCESSPPSKKYGVSHSANLRPSAMTGESAPTDDDAPPSEPICITDLPQLLPLQRQNIELNGLADADIKSCCLPWGSPVGSFLPPVYRRPEVVLAADCVYYEPAFPLLLDTLQALMSSPEDAWDGRDAVCWFCMKKRRKADMRFVTNLKKCFHVEEIQLNGPDADSSIHL